MHQESSALLTGETQGRRAGQSRQHTPSVRLQLVVSKKVLNVGG